MNEIVGFQLFFFNQGILYSNGVIKTKAENLTNNKAKKNNAKLPWLEMVVVVVMARTQSLGSSPTSTSGS